MCLKKKFVFVLILMLLLVFLTGTTVTAQGTSSNDGEWVIHTVRTGESLWILSNQYGVSIDNLMELNNLSSDKIYVGQQLRIKSMPANQIDHMDEPKPTVTYHQVVAGDTPWLISLKYNVSLDQLLAVNGLNQSSIIYPGQTLKIPNGTFEAAPPAEEAREVRETNVASRGNTSNTNPTTTYTNHTVQKGESPWTIAIDYGIPMIELLKANNMTEKDTIMPGQQLKVPVYHIPVQPTVSPEHGEYLDWFTSAQYVWPIGTVATVTDFYTKKSWQVIRSYGVNHADVEPLTADDTAIMKEVWGDQWSWKVRPIIVEVNGRKIAASANGMPHSIQEITDNNFDGHFCIHFLNSRTHNTNSINDDHQRAVRIAAGIQ